MPRSDDGYALKHPGVTPRGRRGEATCPQIAPDSVRRRADRERTRFRFRRACHLNRSGDCRLPRPAQLLRPGCIMKSEAAITGWATSTIAPSSRARRRSHVSASPRSFQRPQDDQPQDYGVSFRRQILGRRLRPRRQGLVNREPTSRPPGKAGWAAPQPSPDLGFDPLPTRRLARRRVFPRSSIRARRLLILLPWATDPPARPALAAGVDLTPDPTGPSGRCSAAVLHHPTQWEVRFASRTRAACSPGTSST
jgi:hypothetical protein